MELLWNELPGEHLIYSGLSQAAIEGRLPVPEGRTVRELLSATGQVYLSAASAEADAVAVEGTVSVDLICMDEKIFAFTSRAAFRHTMAAPGAGPGMTPRVRPELQTLEVKLEDGVLNLCAVANLSMMVTASPGTRTLSGISGITDCEELCRDLELRTCSPEGEDSFRIREEIEAPFAASVVYSEAKAAVREVVPAEDGTLIEGSVYISALVESKTGALSQFTHTLPFSHRTEGLKASWARVSVDGWDLRTAEDFGVVIAEAQLSCELYSAGAVSSRAVLDVFSPTVPFRCTHAPLCPCSLLGAVYQRHSLNETLAIPQGMPDAQRGVYCGTRAFVTSQGIENGRLRVEGLLFARVLYAGESGGIFAFGEDVPFTLEADAPGATDAQVSVEAVSSLSGGGRHLELCCTVLLTGELYSVCRLQTVSGIEECPPPQAFAGLVVCFPAPGETLYSIAQRYNTSRASLRSMDPNLPETLQGGERIMFMA